MQGGDEDSQDDSNSMSSEESFEDTTGVNGCNELYNFSQDSLLSHGIYMLDFTSEIIVWIGSKVKKHIKA